MDFAELEDSDTAELIAAFWSYEAALRANDIDTLEAWLADDPGTLRTDGGVSLVGHDEISAIQRARLTPPARRVERLHLAAAGSGAAFVVAETVRADGERGARSQLWVRRPEGWRVTATHEAASPAAPAKPISSTDGIWRETEGPLPAGGDGPLSGVKVAVKDLFAVAGERIGAGNPDWLAEASPEPRHADAVRLLLEAGAGIAGIAQTEEFAFGLAGANVHYGTPDNAAAPGCVPGGSSSGPAAAVAAGLADLGLGTDTGGSVRVPASYCGLYGIRPTHGAISVNGVHPLAPSFDTVGLFAREPSLLNVAARILLPPADPEPVTGLLVATEALESLGTDVRLAFVAAARAFAGRTGLPLRHIPPLGEGRIDEWLSAFRTVQSSEAWAAHGNWVEAHPGSLGAPIAARFAAGRDIGAQEREHAAEILAGARKELRERIAPGTALLLPASSTAALPRDLPVDEAEKVRAPTLRLTCLASLAGLPAVVEPTMRVGVKPAGLCVVGAPGSDRALLSLLGGEA